MESHILHWTNESLLHRFFIYVIKILVGYAVKSKISKKQNKMFIVKALSILYSLIMKGRLGDGGKIKMKKSYCCLE
ncbi:hypothetical protein CN685_04120 [Bacillus wiedmannii]|nr:hypothetical protein CN685_04120 [Bacillus wiedmannii]